MPKKQGLEAIRKATLHVHHAFCTFPCLRFRTLTSNLLTSRFMENVDTTERFSAVLFQIKIEIEPLTIQFQKNSPTFDKLNEVEFDRIAGSDEVCHSANSLFKKRFRCPRRRCCLIYPQIQRQDDHCSQDFDCDCLFSKQWLPSHFLWNWKTHNI